MSDPAQTARRTDTRDPRKARERALKVLFQADVRGRPPSDVLRQIATDRAGLDLLDAEEDEGAGRDAGRALDGFSRTLVLGVEDHLAEVDGLIEQHAEGWSVERMPVVDRNVLRLAVYELLHEPTPHAVVLNEAVELAKALSTERSHRFINGVLAAISRQLSEAGDAQEPAEGV